MAAIGDFMMGKLSLQERRQLQGTKYSLKNPSTITAGSEWFKDFESIDQLRKHLPLDSVVVTNNSTVDINFYPNDDARFKKTIPSKTIQAFSKSTIGGLNSSRVVNLSGATSISANQIELFLEKEQPNTQSVVDAIVRKFPRWLLG